MTDTVKSSALYDNTIADITFDNGHTTRIESKFETAMNGGATYSGAHWTTFEHFKLEVEQEISLAMERWGLPSATIRYTHVRRTVEQIERRTDVSRFHSERRLISEAPTGDNDD